MTTTAVAKIPANTTAASGCSGKCGISKFGTACAFWKSGPCSKAMMTVLDRELDDPMEAEEHATTPFGGGMMQGYQCGMLWGSTLAAGAQAYRLHGAGPRAETVAVTAAQRLLDAYRAQNKHINCLEITEAHPQKPLQLLWYFLFKAGGARCTLRAADYAPEACKAINSALSEEPQKAPCNPASCAALLAKKMGASDKHVTMAAGLAGGIGLSGGACGALGAAIWLIGVNGQEEGVDDKVINSRISEITEFFLKASGHEYECAEIVGRKFKDIDDHASHLSEGGCSEIIEPLALAALTVGKRGSVPLRGVAPVESQRPAA